MIPVISVIIPAYNAAGFITRAIESALDQAPHSLEVIVIDDASDDDTTAVVDALGARDGRIRLQRRRVNGGPSAARNDGLRVARGAWVALLDADDVFLPGRLARLIKLAEAHDADLIADNICFFDWHAQSVSPPQISLGGLATKIVDLPTYLEKARPFTEELDWGLLKPVLRRGLLQEHNLRYSEYSRHGEDFLFIFDVLASGARYIVTSTAGYIYTLRGSGLSRTSLRYFDMAKQTLALLDRPEVACDPALASRIRARAAAVQRLAYERQFDRHFKDRAWAQLAADLMTRPQLAAKLVRRVSGKLHLR